ncbi:unnamed protein product [Timema podura]|uniref:PDZ domain-containing protein n=1 Tax=Timema podura TaxID=61482 RepID=A0ABN7NTT3_TIMPD|nr:unnamed protein product [Timema podura]
MMGAGNDDRLISILKLKVSLIRSKRNDPLTWRVIEEETVLPPCKTMLPTMESTAVCSVNGGDDGVTDVRLFLNVPPRAKLGCGICKGPDWKPGIFVQFTKENGIAREAGLRPGDQIIHCNGVTFKDITFGDAVHVMKSSRQLDLIVRKRAGLDLFPGESSGYNSSASSVNGDQSPSWEDTKRLSVVKEESMELEERLGQLETNQRKGGLDKNKDWDQIEYEWEKAEQKSGKNRTGTLHTSNKSHKQSGTSCTIISVENDSGHFNGDTRDSNSYTNPNINRENVTVNGTRSQQGQDSGKCSGTKLAEICMISQQQETTTVIVEVHRSEVEDEDENDRSMHTASEASPVMQRPSTAANKEERKLTNLVKSPSSSSFASVASSSASSSLSSAISQELQRRSQRQEDDNFREEERKKDILKTIDDEKRQQHEQLMEEFKKAHRKMFAHALVAQNCNNKSQTKLGQLGREKLALSLLTDGGCSVGMVLLWADAMKSAPPPPPYIIRIFFLQF